MQEKLEKVQIFHIEEIEFFSTSQVLKVKVA